MRTCGNDVKTRLGAILALALALAQGASASAHGETSGLCADEMAFAGGAVAEYVCFAQGAACPAGCLDSADYCDCGRTGMAVDQASCAALLPGESNALVGAKVCFWKEGRPNERRYAVCARWGTERRPRPGG